MVLCRFHLAAEGIFGKASRKNKIADNKGRQREVYKISWNRWVDEKGPVKLGDVVTNLVCRSPTQSFVASCSTSNHDNSSLPRLSIWSNDFAKLEA